MGPFRTGAASHQPTPLFHISSIHRADKDEARIKMKTAIHQEEENKGKRDARKEKRQVTDFKET